jgi:protein O-GlcNAc transferase
MALMPFSAPIEVPICAAKMSASELVTHSIEDYEALALRLAKDPSLLEGYRNRLAKNRLTHPLFDIDRFRCHIEAAYLQMLRFGSEASRFAVDAVQDGSQIA